MRALALQWYSLLSSLNAAVAEPLMALGDGLGVPLVAALLMGLLGATSPCQLTTNASALAIVSRRLRTPRASMLSALAYLVGKLLVYSVLGGLVVLAGREAATGTIPFIVAVRKVFGPLMLLIGLVFLGVLRLPVSFGAEASAWVQQRVVGGGPRGSFLLGSAYALCFCPTQFWLFFGLTIPLALRSSVGVLYPPVFALGATLPLLGVAGLLAVGAGAGRTTGYVQRLQGANRVFERVAGVVLVLAGLNDTFVYWFL